MFPTVVSDEIEHSRLDYLHHTINGVNYPASD